MNPTNRAVTLLATLGGQPQIVTFALDALLARRINVSEVIVLYLPYDQGRITRALNKLRKEFQNGSYGGHPMTLETHTLGGDNPSIIDIFNERDANMAWEAITKLISSLKNKGKTLHICNSGGRRVLGHLTMSAASLLFGYDDRLWHVYTPKAWQVKADEGALMHLPAEAGSNLIEVPMMPWGTYFPVLRQLANPTESIDDVLSVPRRFFDQQDRAHCLAVIERLSERQQEVLLAFAAGCNPQEVAETLSRSIKTIHSHKTVILGECRNEWAIDESVYLDYHFLARKFEFLVS